MMNDYGFDYMNYVMNIPNKMNNQNMFSNNNYITDNSINANKILEPYNGFVRGNIFDGLYDSYKSFKPGEVNARDEREALMYQIMQYKFNLVDLNLYLDTNPNDSKAINLYNKYLMMEKQACDKFESMFGPITLDSSYLNTNKWVWDNSPWPWEVI